MRPKKTILLVCASEGHAETLRFLLETRGYYQVYLVDNADEALWLVKVKPIRVLMAEATAHSAAASELVRRAKEIDRDLPCLVFSRTCNASDRAGLANHFIPEALLNSEEILLRVGVLSTRKRGPKKGAVASRGTQAVPA